MNPWNHCHVIGRVGLDPEIKTTPNGKRFARFSLCERKISRDAPDRWHQFIAWDNAADLAQRLLHKGTMAKIDATMAPNKWTDAQGVKHERMELIVEVIGVLEQPKQPDRNPPVQQQGSGMEFDDCPL